MKRYKLILFDLDGTLADTSQGIIECHRYTNEVMGKPISDLKTLRSAIGGPLLHTYQTRFGYHAADAKRAVEIYREHYAEVGEQGSILYPGINACLDELNGHGYLLAVATLKEQRLARSILTALGIASYFNLIHGMDPHDTLTKKDLVELCMHELSVPAEYCILVGDSVHDAVGAEKAGIDFLGVTYGFGFSPQQEQKEIRAVAMVHNCAAIRDFFMSAWRENI